MVDRGFGIEIETGKYGELIEKEDFDLDWFVKADSVDFKLNDEPVTKSGGSRMIKRARAGYLKPTGSTSHDADLQRFAWYFRAFLDNYKYTEGSDDVNTHEFWGGEGKQLTSFRGVAVYDMLKKYIYGLICDGLKFEVSDEGMNIDADWIYKTEKAGIIGQDGETWECQEALTNDLFLMAYDIYLKLNNKPLYDPEDDENFGIATSFSYEGSNNHDVDGTVGLGSRAPQIRAQAIGRENNISITTSLIEDTVRSILDAQYGKVGALEPSKCELLQIPLQVDVRLCEIPDIGMTILFPKITLNVEYDMSGADRIEVTMNIATLGSDKAELLDGSEVVTDMYVRLWNNQGELGVKVSP